jgi:hypothetical protein
LCRGGGIHVADHFQLSALSPTKARIKAIRHNEHGFYIPGFYPLLRAIAIWEALPGRPYVAGDLRENL